MGYRIDKQVLITVTIKTIEVYEIFKNWVCSAVVLFYSLFFVLAISSKIHVGLWRGPVLKFSLFSWCVSIFCHATSRIAIRAQC